MKRIRSRKGAPGIVDVAARAGVSPATVSRTFNNPESVRQPTRNRIHQAASDLGYIRDRLASAMHNHSSGTVGLIVPTIDNAIFSELIEAFGAELQRHDRTMLVAAHNYDLAAEIAIVRSLLERRTDAIVLTGFEHEPVPLNMLSTRSVPAISIWNYDESSQIPCIGSDNFEAGYAVTSHLTKHGHQDMAFLFPDISNNDRARDRRLGAMAALRDAGVDWQPDRVLDCRYDIGEAKALVQNLLRDDPPSAIVCGNDVIAHGAIFACQAENRAVPEQISIVGIGDFRGSAHMEPALSTVRLPAKRIGVRAAQTIVHMIETGAPPIQFHQKIEVEFMNRKSVAAINP